MKAADLNDIQDCIVGAKHPELTRPYSAAAFQLVAGGSASLGDGQWTFAALSTLVANIDLPAGDRITTVEYFYNRGGSGNVTMKLRRRKKDGTAAADVAPSPVVDSTGTGFESTVITFNHTLDPLFVYWLQVQCDAAANVFGGALAKHDHL